MQLGISTYSLSGALRQGWPLEEALCWIRDQGAGHVELVEFDGDLSAARAFGDLVRSLGLYVSNLAVSGDFLHRDPQAEADRLCALAEAAQAMGAPRMRFDNNGPGRPEAGNCDDAFAQDLPRLAKGCRQVAAYAQELGVQALVENHGYYVNGSQRLLQLLAAVGHENFSVLLDVGNMVCVDEEPFSCVAALLPHVKMVHVKDFYLRGGALFQGRPGWFVSQAGRFLRGAIAGHGDLPLGRILGLIRESGFDGDLSLEFEGLEECRFGCAEGLEMVRRLWGE